MKTIHRQRIKRGIEIDTKDKVKKSKNETKQILFTQTTNLTNHITYSECQAMQVSVDWQLRYRYVKKHIYIFWIHDSLLLKWQRAKHVTLVIVACIFTTLLLLCWLRCPRNIHTFVSPFLLLFQFRTCLCLCVRLFLVLFLDIILFSRDCVDLCNSIYEIARIHKQSEVLKWF